MIDRNDIVETSIQPFGSSYAKNEHNLYSFSRLIIMNEWGKAEYFYIIDIILTTLMTKISWDE